MSGKNVLKNAFMLGAVALLLAACNLPRGTGTPTGAPPAAYTAAAQTVSAELTKAANGDLTPEETLQLSVTVRPTGEQLSTTTPQPLTPTPENAPEETEVPCNHLTFLKDVNYPDGTDLSPQEEFTKTWRLKNSGSCTWTPGYSLVFDRGDAMGGPAATRLSTEDVPPGETVEVSVDLQAPGDRGTYQGYWKLRSNTGQVFGYGEDSKAFWVKINVVEGSGVMFDFNVQAKNAAWGSGTLPLDFEGPGEDVLVFGSTADPGEPFVDVKTEQTLENGKVSGHLLVTYPAVGEERYLIGRYPEYLVNPGDVLTGKVGLIKNPDDTCGNGDVGYRISYAVDGNTSQVESLWSWNEICDGEMRSFQVELDELEGDSIQIFLSVVAHTSSDENYAVWDSLAIKR